jgi:ribosomal protein S5
MGNRQHTTITEWIKYRGPTRPKTHNHHHTMIHSCKAVTVFLASALTGAGLEFP